jgi:hypothetical protein
MIGGTQYEKLKHAVFGAGADVFAVLDGAQVTDLPARLQALEATCLFAGDLDPMLRAAAPHLARIQPDSAGCRLLLQEGWNAHWGIALLAERGTSLDAVRNQLRRNLKVRGPDGNALFFRFYDPRAFRAVLPTMDEAQLEAFYGPLLGCWVEGRSPDTALLYSRSGGEPRVAPIHAG